MPIETFLSIGALGGAFSAIVSVFILIYKPFIKIKDIENRNDVQDLKIADIEKKVGNEECPCDDIKDVASEITKVEKIMSEAREKDRIEYQKDRMDVQDLKNRLTIMETQTIERAKLQDLHFFTLSSRQDETVKLIEDLGCNIMKASESIQKILIKIGGA